MHTRHTHEHVWLHTLMHTRVHLLTPTHSFSLAHSSSPTFPSIHGSGALTPACTGTHSHLHPYVHTREPRPKDTCSPGPSSPAQAAKRDRHGWGGPSSPKVGPGWPRCRGHQWLLRTSSCLGMVTAPLIDPIISPPSGEVLSYKAGPAGRLRSQPPDLGGRARSQRTQAAG